MIPSLGAYEPAFAETTLNSLSIAFDPDPQSVTLTASVLYGSNPETEGTVSFTVKDSLGNIVGTTTSNTVVNGSATVSYALPAGLAPGVYTLQVAYTDPSGTIVDGGDTAGTLSIVAGGIITTAQAASANYDMSGQSVQLSADLSNAIDPSAVVGEGTVTFTVTDSQGNTIGTATSGTVSNGTATVSYALPGGLLPGGFNINVSYADTHFSDGGDIPGLLSIVAADVATSVQNVATGFSSNFQNITLNAAITDTSHPADIVNTGQVAFLVLSAPFKPIGPTLTAPVDNGVATVTYTLPGSLSNGTYIIQAGYTDASGKFLSSGTETGTLAVGVALPPPPVSPPSPGSPSSPVSPPSPPASSGGSSSSGASSVMQNYLTEVLLDAIFLTVGLQIGNPFMAINALTDFESVVAPLDAGTQLQLEFLFVEDIAAISSSVRNGG